ncbi:MAG: endonuclease III [Lentisphaerae bacterium]|nr:endonuclease III [Lentisphaerota bacterium]
MTAGRHADVGGIFRALNRAYGPARLSGALRPLDVLVRTILSQNTSDRNSGRAYLNLRRRFPRWARLVKASPRSIADAIRSGGLANLKALRLKQVFREIIRRNGRLTLRNLRELNDREALEWLTRLPGVGMKTACCLLLFSFRRPVMPVDTHVARISRRLGWTCPSHTPLDRVHEILESLIPPGQLLAMHLLLIRHGRAVCRPTRPRCGACPLRRFCLEQQS